MRRRPELIRPIAFPVAKGGTGRFPKRTGELIGSRVVLLVLVLYPRIGPAADGCVEPYKQSLAPIGAIVSEKEKVDRSFAKYHQHVCGEELTSLKFETTFGADRRVCNAYTRYLSAQQYGVKSGRCPRCVRWFSQENSGIVRPHIDVIYRVYPRVKSFALPKTASGPYARR